MLAEPRPHRYGLTFDREGLTGFCRRWRVTELSLFGSVARDESRPDSDIDVLVTFAPEAPWSLLRRPRCQASTSFVCRSMPMKQ